MGRDWAPAVCVRLTARYRYCVHTRHNQLQATPAFGGHSVAFVAVDLWSLTHSLTDRPRACGSRGAERTLPPASKPSNAPTAQLPTLYQNSLTSITTPVLGHQQHTAIDGRSLMHHEMRTPRIQTHHARARRTWENQPDVPTPASPSLSLSPPENWNRGSFAVKRLRSEERSRDSRRRCQGTFVCGADFIITHLG